MKAYNKYNGLYSYYNTVIIYCNKEIKNCNKVIIFSFLIMVFSSLTLKAQEFKAGVLVGGVASQVDGDRQSGFHKAGLSMGAFVFRDLNRYTRLQGELLYTMKGSRVSSKNTDYSLYQIDANYIDMNLLYVFKITEDFNVSLGLTPSVLLYSDEQTQLGVASVGAPAFRKFNVLGVAGVSYNFTRHLSLSWRYSYSIYSIRSGKSEIYDLEYKEQNSQRHNYMSFVLGY